MIKYVIDVIRFMKKYPLSTDGRFIVWLRNCLYLNWQKPWKWNVDIYWLWKQIERSRRMKYKAGDKFIIEIETHYNHSGEKNSARPLDATAGTVQGKE